MITKDELAEPLASYVEAEGEAEEKAGAKDCKSDIAEAVDDNDDASGDDNDVWDDKRGEGFSKNLKDAKLDFGVLSENEKGFTD